MFTDVEKRIKIKCNIYGDTLNTFENYYYGNSSETNNNKVSFFLSIDEQNEIINALNIYRFFELPDTIQRIDYKDRKVTFEYHSQSCAIELNKNRKSVYMSEFHNIETGESIRFEKIIKVIYNIIEKRQDLRRFHKSMWWI